MVVKIKVQGNWLRDRVERWVRTDKMESGIEMYIDKEGWIHFIMKGDGKDGRV